MAKAPKKAASLVAGSRPARRLRPEVVREKFPDLERYPALHRALVLLQELQKGKSRAEAEEVAERKVGPRSPRWLAKHPPRRGRKAKPPGESRGERPEPEKRVRVRSTTRRRRRGLPV